LRIILQVSGQLATLPGLGLAEPLHAAAHLFFILYSSLTENRLPAYAFPAPPLDALCEMC
jgi:hypothetical protein